MNERNREIQNAHLARVAIMLSTGLLPMARYYVAVLHHLCMLEIARWRGSRDEHGKGERIAEQEQLADGYLRASERAGFSGPDLIHAAGFIAPVEVESDAGRVWYTRFLDDGHHGVFVTASPRDGGRLFLELQVLIHDIEGTSLVLTMTAMDQTAARAHAGRWAALGEAVLTAEAARPAGGST